MFIYLHVPNPSNTNLKISMHFIVISREIKLYTQNKAMVIQFQYIQLLKLNFVGFCIALRNLPFSLQTLCPSFISVAMIKIS